MHHWYLNGPSVSLRRDWDETSPFPEVSLRAVFDGLPPLIEPLVVRIVPGRRLPDERLALERGLPALTLWRPSPDQGDPSYVDPARNSVAVRVDRLDGATVDARVRAHLAHLGPGIAWQSVTVAQVLSTLPDLSPGPLSLADRRGRVSAVPILEGGVAVGPVPGSVPVAPVSFRLERDLAGLSATFEIGWSPWHQGAALAQLDARLQRLQQDGWTLEASELALPA